MDLQNIHSNNVNVAKFAHKNPWLFSTSCIDGSIKIFDVRMPDLVNNHIFEGKTKNPCLMVCFSPDDRYVLSSSEDNEICQWDVNERRMDLNIDHLPKRLTGKNYSRSYYMSHGKLIITGSVDQGQIFVTSSVDGKLVREIELGDIPGQPTYAKAVKCQSLRGDPVFPSRFAVISSYDGRSPTSGEFEYKLVTVDLGHGIAGS